MSWKPEVKVGGAWSRNGLVFATREEAERSAQELMGRWLAVEDARAVESDHPVNYAYQSGALVRIEQAA